jgi:hypothetical protein
VREVLRRLADTVGVKGTAVVTRDGIVIASHLPRSLPEDLVAAMASSVLNRTRRAVDRHGIGEFTRVTLVANHGKMVLTDAGPAFLVVVLDRNVDPGPVGIEIESAAMRIRQQGEIRV